MNAPFPELELPPDLAPDLRLLGIGLNECERALLDCWPVVLHDRTYAKLFGLGIYGDGVNGRGPFDALACDAVCFLPGRRFECARDMRDARGHEAAIIIPARDEDGELVDLAAWEPDTGALALWRGCVAMLGEEQLNAPRIETPVLTVFADVASWLRAGQRGVVIIDPARARWRLAGERLAVADAAHGRRLRAALRLPEPRIFVYRDSARRAA
jgi:hypothetical protein